MVKCSTYVDAIDLTLFPLFRIDAAKHLSRHLLMQAPLFSVNAPERGDTCERSVVTVLFLFLTEEMPSE